MAIFKKIIFGLNVVGPQGINVPNDFIIGETTDGKTAVLVGDQIVQTGGLEYVDEQGNVHAVPTLPSLPTNTTKYYKLVEHNKTLSWEETTGLDIPALPADINTKTYVLETTSSGMAWVEKTGGGGGDTSIPVSFMAPFGETSDYDVRVKVNNTVILNAEGSDIGSGVSSHPISVLLHEGDVISFELVVAEGIEAECNEFKRVVVNANGTFSVDDDTSSFAESYTILEGTRSISFDIGITS